METTCQASYPLNSENESPFGTFTVYLSCAEMVGIFHLLLTPRGRVDCRRCRPPLHRHTRKDEWFYVLDGELTSAVDGQRFTGGGQFGIRSARHGPCVL